MDKWRTRLTNQINTLVIHQSLSNQPLDQIRKYHMSKNNHITPGDPLPNVAYHIVIDFDGKVIFCNDFCDYVFHTYGANKNGIGICVLGHFVGKNYSPSDATKGPNSNQIYALDQLVQALQAQFPLILDRNVRGHFDYGKNACPGTVLETWIKEYRGELVAPKAKAEA